MGTSNLVSYQQYTVPDRSEPLDGSTQILEDDGKRTEVRVEFLILSQLSIDDFCSQGLKNRSAYPSYSRYSLHVAGVESTCG